MTIIEQRYMERVPEMLNRIAQSLNTLAEAVEQLNSTIEHKLNQQPKE